MIYDEHWHIDANDVYGPYMFNPSGGRNAYPNPAYGEIGSECN